MPELVGIIDTSVMCCWLEVPGRETAGSADGKWNSSRATNEIDRIVRSKGTLILPTSVVIETANHISQSNHSRREKAKLLFDKIIGSIEGTQPWRQFAEADRLWNREWYKNAQMEFPDYAGRGIGLADYSILKIARYFNDLGSEVQTLTSDAQLAAEVGHLPAKIISRRRR